MGYWGWRPLVFGLFISTWVVGCNIVTDNNVPSAAPSAYPRVTLTVGRLPTAQVSAAPTRAAPTRAFTPSSSPAPSAYVVQPGDTLAEIAAQFGLSLEALQAANEDASTLVPGQSLLIPTSFPLLVQPPTCYPTRPGNLLCLGRVDNPLPFPVESVELEVRLRHADGSIYLSERSTVDQTALPDGSFAPYQATFTANEGEVASADAVLINAVAGTENRFVMLLIQEVKGQRTDGRMIVSAVIYNPGSENAELLRAFVTLLDSLGRVIGYRVVTFASGTILAAGSHLPLDIEVTPQVSAETYDYLLYVEARPLEN